jgi:HEAT repeat protein
MTQAADALPTNLFPTPATFGEYSVRDLLRAAAHGRIGVDQRLIRSIFERPDKPAVIADLMQFAGEAKDQPLDLRADLIEILRRFKTTEAIPFYLEVIREYGDDYPDELIEAVVEQGTAIVEPLLKLYEELGEEQGGPVAFLLAGLQVQDPRILQVLLEEIEYDTWEGAFHLGMYGDKAARPVLESRLAEPDLDEDMKHQIVQALTDIEERASGAKPSIADPPDIYDLFDPEEGPDFDVIPMEDVLHLLKSGDRSYRSEALETLSPGDLDEDPVKNLVVGMARSDSDPNVRGRAWEALSSVLEETPDLLEEMKAVLNDTKRPAEERSGALVALATATEGSEELKAHLKEMYEVAGERKHVLKAMWRTMDQSFASYMRFNLDDEDPEVVEQAIFGIGYLGVTSEVNRLEKFFQHDRLRSPALFNYSLIIPGPKDRMGVKLILKKIEKVASGLNSDEREIVKIALDRRLEMRGMKPVFHEDHDFDEDDG